MKLPAVPEYSKEAFEEAGKFLHEDKIAELAHRYNERYLHWEELKHRKLPLNPVIVWNLMKVSRELKAKSLEFGDWIFKYNLIDEFQEKLHILDKSAAGNLLSSLDALQDNRRKYIINSLMEEAIASSQIEGAATTREIAKRMLQENRKPKNKDEKMIVNNYDTVKHIVDLKNEAITPEKILEIHRMITNGTLEKTEYEGNFRENNEIAVYSHDGTLLHKPVEYPEVPKLIDELCDFANSKDENFIHPIIKGIIIHFLVGYIHPFNDGNGRTARALFYWYLLKNDYWLFEYMAVSRVINNSKKQYRNAYLYTESDRTPNDSGDLTYFLKYNLDCIKKALDDILEYLERKQKEQFQALKIITESGNLTLRQAEILKQFLKQPEKPVTIKEIVTTYSVAYATARSDLFQLEKLGYVEKRKAGKEFIFIFKKVD
ncbi:MAG: Fic family protein [Methanosarcina sp.]|uniref:Fic family protein n=1 Tax=Methanosarcina sp. TaxID=2213 RepID=UPI00260742E7|nr:Fic family protein [Methanosarcina sp.]MDD3247312.1 Fic family protein [Methanosarcina sp.]MDD4249272.1 Fic family protein [Methanosarcina sp.]